MTRLIDLPTLARLVHGVGVARFLELLAGRPSSTVNRVSH